MKEDQYRSQFRLPYSLYEKLKSAADERGESLNKELVTRLERSFTIQDLGGKVDSLDMAAFFAMALLVANDEDVMPEQRKEILGRARELARPLLENLVAGKGPSPVEHK